MAKKDYKKVVEEGIGKITPEDIGDAVKKGNKARHKSNQGVLKQLVSRIHECASMLEDYADGKYRDIPWWSLSAAAMMILYIVNPFDIIPDVIPIIGLIDDLAVATVVLALIGEDVKRWREWKKEYDKAEKQQKKDTAEEGQEDD